MAAGGLGQLEFDERALNVGSGEFGGLQAFDFFLARGGLRGTGAGGKARNEILQLGDFLFAHLVFGFDARADGGLGEDHVVVAANVGDDGLVVDVGDVSADLVEEMAVVRNDDKNAFVGGQVILEPVDGIEVEIVGGLVKKERGRVAEKGLGEKDANLLAAL